VEGLGKGFSSVAIVDGRIYTMGAAPTPAASAAAPAPRGRGRNRGNKRGVGSKGDCSVIALDVQTGKQIWSTPVAKGDPNCTPTVDGNRVYALGRNGELACLDTADGRIVWSKSLTDDFGGKMMSGWGYSESPLVDGDKLLCTPGADDAMIVALDKKTGSTLWKGAVPSDLGPKGGDGAGYASIVISRGAGVKQYVQLVGRGLVSFRAEDGKFLWNYNRIANPTANIPTPLVDGNYIFTSTGYQAGAALLELHPEGHGVGVKEVYFLPGNEVQNHHGGMVLIGDHVYMGNGHNAGFPLCLELKTGKVVWKGGRGPGTGSAAVLEANGELYFRYQNGVMALIEANPEKYVLKGKFDLATHNGESWPHPVIVDHCLYVRDQDALLCYDIAKH
jgi:outer membrane protein assembly factor BamB